MEFAFTEEQQMIRDTAESFLKDISTPEAVRQAMATEQGFDPDLWKRICTDMYWQAILVPEQYGGLGLGYVELTAVIEQMGRFLLCSPFFSTVCLGVNSLLVAGNDEQKQQYLPAIAEGSLTATLACYSDDPFRIHATYSKQGDNYVLNGECRYVPDGHTANLLVIPARAAGSNGDEGISLFLVPADSAGVKREWQPTMDQTRKQACITLAAVKVPGTARMGHEGNAWELLQKILQLACVGIAADQMGGSQQILDMTVAYTKERVQFGRPIASFQALKHKAADMMLKCEVSRSAVYYAACVAQEALFGADVDAIKIASELPEAAAMVKAYCSDTYFFNAGNAIQMFGGVGFTWEYDVHLYFKRAKSSEVFLGDGSHHREKIAALLLDQD